MADPAVGPPSAADDSPGNERPLVSVVIPTLNEAKNLPYVLPQIPQEYEVIIVDGDSEDGSTAVAAELRPSARIVQQTGHGKGNALRVGFQEARGEIIVMLDADGSSRVEEIQHFVAALREGADFAKGSRFFGDGGGSGSADITRLRRVGTRGLRGLVNLLFGSRYTDLCYGFNAFWASCLPQLGLSCDGFEADAQITIRAHKARLQVVEVPCFEDARIHGVSNLHAVRDGWCVLRMILRERFSGEPHRATGHRASGDSDLVGQPSE